MGLGQRQQGVELGDLQALEVVGGGAVVDHPALVDHVGQAIGHPGGGRRAVAAGAAGLLVITFNVLGQVEVGDKADVGLVDAHAESDRGHHHDAVLAQKAVLVPAPHILVQPGVVRQREHALGV